MIALAFPSFPHAGEASRRAICINNLKQIVLGLQNYHDTYGTFPPAYVADENGKPMHSWRVLILPFIEQNTLYEQYDFSEPWDGPNNRSLSSVVLQVFCCPSDPAGYTTNTSYVLITGDETGWVADRPSCFKEFADGPSETIVLVEIANSNIHWMEPRDLTFSQAMRGINAPAGVCISSYHPGGANAACADGSVHFLPDTLPASEIRALITIDGQERIHPDW